MPASSESIEHSYAPPVRQLLALGEPLGREKRAWRDYTALGISPAAEPDLIRMATDGRLNDGPPASKLVWAPLHAWRALGQLRAPAAVAPLLALLRRIDDAQDDYVAEELPRVFAQIGGAAIAPAAQYLAEAAHGEWARVAAASALGQIGQQHPETRAECAARLAAQLEKFATQPEPVNTFLIASLMDLRAVEAAPVIEAAFASGRVDEEANGDWEDVQIRFGLKTQRAHPRKPNRTYEMRQELAELREEIADYEQESAELRDALEMTETIAPQTNRLSDDAIPMPHLAPPKTGRNEPCPCGSGKKFKKCCGA